jgi:hypothetical protein
VLKYFTNEVNADISDAEVSSCEWNSFIASKHKPHVGYIYKLTFWLHRKDCLLYKNHRQVLFRTIVALYFVIGNTEYTVMSERSFVCLLKDMVRVLTTVFWVLM